MIMMIIITVTKELIREQEDLEIRGRVVTTRTTSLKSARILGRVLETRGDLLSLPVKDHQLTLMWKTLMNNNDNMHTDHLISARRPDLIIINKKKKKRICKIVDFAVPADQRIKLKECEKKDKYLDLARGVKKLWKMRVTIVSIVIDTFCTMTKGLLKGLEDLEVGGRVGRTIQMTALLRTARILKRVLEAWGDLLSLKLFWKNII